MAKQLSWREAIEQVLGEAGAAMHYTDIASEIIARRLRSKVGATPANTVNYELNRNIRDLGDDAVFARTGEGEYILRSALMRPEEAAPQADASLTGQGDSASALIAAFGMFWRRELVSWSSSPKLLGQQPGAEVVDLSEQKGVYLLHDGRHVVYVGRAMERALGKRLLDHTTDRLNGRWDRFSWFGVSMVEDSGNLSAPESQVVTTTAALLAAYEALLIEALEPPQNRKRGDDLRVREFLQVEDRDIDRGRKARLLQELSAKL